MSELPGWGGPAAEERAEIGTLRDEADRAAADAARTVAELARRLSPRGIVSRGIASRLPRDRTARIAAVVLPVAVLVAVAAVMALRRS